MTKDIVLAYINRRKASFGSWANLSVEVGVDASLLRKVANGDRELSEQVLKAFGIERTVRESYKFSKEREDKGGDK